MSDFFATSQRRVTSELPRVKRAARETTRANLVAVLEAAKLHLNNIAHNPLAVEHQRRRIAEHEQRLNIFDQHEWIDL